MIERICRLVSALAVVFFAGTVTASAHPHVWVTIRSEVLYSPDGSVTAVRHAWTFDDMFSVFATQGLASKQKGVFTREELAPLAEVNVSSLKEYDYFTFAKMNGKKAPLADPVDYWLEFTNGALTLHFTLPLKSPMKATSLNIEIYDATWFVDFSFAEKDPVTLVGAPADCKLAVTRPNDPSASQSQPGEAFFNSLTSASNYGAQFANKVAVKCP